MAADVRWRALAPTRIGHLATIRPSSHHPIAATAAVLPAQMSGNYTINPNGCATAHFQWGVADPAAKGIDLAFSNGGTVKLVLARHTKP